MLPLINSAYFQNLIEGFTNGVLIINTKGEVYVANTSAGHILGCSAEACKGDSWQNLLEAIVYKPEFKRFMKDAKRADRCNLPFFTPYKRNDGSLLYLNLTTSPLVDSGKLFGIMILITDVTSMYQMHEREKAILEERNVLQRERLEGLKNLSTAVAHQIRNPMMTIGGFANLMLRKGECNPETNREFLEGIVEASHRLESIVTAVSEYTSLSLGEQSPTMLDEAVGRARKAVEAKAGEMGRSLNWDIDLDPVELPADPALLTRALYELMLNSVEGSRNGDGRIQVNGRINETMYHLTLSDNGNGIDQRSLPFVTDPFFTTKTVGVGMGLCTVERIVKEHNGLLDIKSAPGAGTTVAIHLPLSPA